MPLDATAVDTTIDNFIATYHAGYEPPGLRTWYKAFLTAIYDGITANAIVLPTGVPPLSNGGGPVVGTGVIT